MWYTPKMPKNCFSKFIRNSETISWFALYCQKIFKKKKKKKCMKVYVNAQKLFLPINCLNTNGINLSYILLNVIKFLMVNDWLLIPSNPTILGVIL